jgi:cystathionine gamma-synthase
MSSSSPPESLTPEAAGREANRLAALRYEHSAAKTTSMMSTRVAHAGVQSFENAPMAPPIHMATTYTRPVDGLYRDADSVYGREDNPTRLLLEREVGILECLGRDGKMPESSAVCACAFSSGMMAISSVLLAHSAPLHVFRHKDLYHGVSTALVKVFKRFGVTTTSVDMTDLDALRVELSRRAELAGDVILWMESPSNPLLDVLDITSICELANEARQQMNLNVTTAVDSTLAPPPLSQSLLMGADVAVHSATKFLAGHSDATIGVATASPWTSRGKQLGPRLREVQTATGGVASPMDSWLTLRGIRTLHVRVARQSETAMKVAAFLERQPLVSRVRYPGLASHPQHSVAQRQMSQFGGLLSVEMSSAAEAMAVAAALTTIRRATSLGGTETLIEHRASIEPEGRRSSPPGLVRLSIGLEDADDLIEDLSRALAIAQEVCGNAS